MLHKQTIPIQLENTVFLINADFINKTYAMLFFKKKTIKLIWVQVVLSSITSKPRQNLLIRRFQFQSTHGERKHFQKEQPLKSWMSHFVCFIGLKPWSFFFYVPFLHLVFVISFIWSFWHFRLWSQLHQKMSHFTQCVLVWNINRHFPRLSELLGFFLFLAI